MFSIQKWKCSWSLVLTVASILALASVVHLFLFPVLPSFEYFSARQVQNACVPINGSIKGGKNDVLQNPQPFINLDVRFPADLHKAVVYRGAPWKAEIGRWLSGCNSVAKAVKVFEIIGGKSCKNDCSGQGICNRELGQCRCFHGFSGKFIFKHHSLEATTKISACQLINLRQQITKLQACLQQMSPAKQTEEETEELTNQVLDEIGVDVASLLSVSPKGRIVGKTTEDANRMKRKIKTFKAPCIMDEALCVRASPSLPRTMDGASSPYVSRMKRKRKTFKAPCIIDEAFRVRASPSLPRTMDGPSSSSVSRMKRKRKTFKAPCTIDEALRVRASPSLPRTMDGPSSSSVSSPHTISTTLTRRGRGFARGIKEWGTGTKIQVKFDDKFQPVEDDGKKLKGQLGLIVRSGHRVPLTYLSWNVMHVDIKENIWQEVKDNLVYCPDEFKEVCMRLCRTSWKDHKSKTKSKYWVPFKNDPDIASRVPSNIVPSQWRKLVQYWASKEVQAIAKKNSFNRGFRGPPHTTGRTSFSDIRFNMTHKGERIDKMSLWKRAHNLNDPDVVAIVEEYNVHLWKVPKEQHTIEYCDGIYHKIVGKDGHGYCKTYGRGVPWSAVYARGSGPSQSLAAPSFIDEITQRVTQDVESRFTTTIKNLTARVLFLESQGVVGSMSLREVSDASSGQQASKENE